jgi:DNA primase
MKELTGLYIKNLCPFCDFERKSFTISENISRFYCFNCCVSGSYEIKKSIESDEYKKMIAEYAKSLRDNYVI